MFVMTYSQARQNLSSLLDSVKENGMAYITRADGSKFKIVPAETQVAAQSPFAELAQYSSTVNSKLKTISMREIVEMMHESWDERSDKINSDAAGSSARKFFALLKK